MIENFTSIGFMDTRVRFFSICSVFIPCISILFLSGCARHKTQPVGIPAIVDSVHSFLIDNFSTVEKGVFYRSGQLSAGRLTTYIKRYGGKKNLP
jgi:hypothetical protein